LKKTSSGKMAECRERAGLARDKRKERAMTQELALVTGASSGIGLELARQFAKHGHDLVITAPVQGELDAIASDLGALHDVQVHPIAADLENEDGPETLLSAIRQRRLEIGILVNNAGRGVRGKFAETPLSEDLGMIRLNIAAVVSLTRSILPDMLARGRGRILNTASIAGFEPGPLLAVYHATKAFVLSFSEALATELQDSGVSVTALCPGPVDTDFFPKADMVDTVAFQKANVMAPQDVAEAGYDAVMRGERVIVPGGINKAMVFARRMLPESAQAKKNEKYYEDVEPMDAKRRPGEIAAKREDDGALSTRPQPVSSQINDNSKPEKNMSTVNSLKELLVEELRDLLDAEKQLTKALPKMAKAASSEELKEGFEMHLEETKTHVERLKEAFEILGETARGKTCAAMKGLIEEGSEAIALEGPDNLRDAKLIGAAQRVEHYEIAAYGTARAFAETIGETRLVELLQQTLDEEGETDKKLTALAETINQEAFAEAGAEEGE
jgi:uncharacterized protein